MPEQPADYQAYLPVEDRDDHFITVQMPRSALRSLSSVTPGRIARRSPNRADRRRSTTSRRG
jgi:hypothetical protein